MLKTLQSEVILELTKKLHNFFGPNALGSLQIDLKMDQSFVTEIDLYVSELIKEKLTRIPAYANYAFFCEEDFKEYQFPCAILDPIDGTRELIKGRPECAVSLALMKDSSLAIDENYAWIYNPFSGFSLDSSVPFIATKDRSSQKLLGLVSRSEYHKGYFNKFMGQTEADLSPRGSIAFKLGLLASGACDFVISLAPKNVWDIAAGTLLCEQRGMHFYQDGKIVDSLLHDTYSGVLIWTHPQNASRVFKIFDTAFQK